MHLTLRNPSQWYSKCNRCNILMRKSQAELTSHRNKTQFPTHLTKNEQCKWLSEPAPLSTSLNAHCLDDWSSRSLVTPPRCRHKTTSPALVRLLTLLASADSANCAHWLRKPVSTSDITASAVELCRTAPHHTAPCSARHSLTSLPVYFTLGALSQTAHTGSVCFTPHCVRLLNESAQVTHYTLGLFWGQLSAGEGSQGPLNIILSPYVILKLCSYFLFDKWELSSVF